MILKSTYFGDVNWYRLIACTNEPIYIDSNERFIKQTSRNHCIIATANGTQKLTVPVSFPINSSILTGYDNRSIKNVQISDHGNWRHQHWEALKSAYGMSPFFEYYADDIEPFFVDKWDSLLNYNMDITTKMLDLIGIDKTISFTNSNHEDAASTIKSKFGNMQGNAHPITYYQTFQRRHGFIPDLSILDLLFNEGPESLRKLQS